jgi:integrase
MRAATLWADPRTGIWTLRRRVPKRFAGVADQRGGMVKISSGTADRKQAAQKLPALLLQWEAMVADWERRLNVVVMTPERAAEVAAQWVAWIQGGAKLEMDGADSDVFEPLNLPEERTPERIARMWDVIERHADEAVKVAGITLDVSGRPILLQTLARPVSLAYLQADLTGLGIGGSNPALRPLDAARASLPSVPDASSKIAELVPKHSLKALYAAWKVVAVVKPRTMAEADYAFKALTSFLGHDDAAQVTREALARWRDSIKAAGATNNTWNNRISLVRQFLMFGVAEGFLPSDPTEGLRLRKNRQTSPLPYSDADAAQILLAARLETLPSLRWSHWLMAFTGMRAAEALQLLGRDVRQEGDTWIIDVNGSDPTQSVKTGQRRHVPVHPALIREGFIAYAQTIAADAPVFPDKKLDRFGNRGGRAWNVIGKWARQKAGITDPNKAPDHSWRHRVEDEMRAAEVPEDVRDAIVGHARKTTGRQYGVRKEALSRLARYLAMIPIPPGVFPAATALSDPIAPPL